MSSNWDPSPDSCKVNRPHTDFSGEALASRTPGSDTIPQILKDYAPQGNVPPRLSGLRFFVSLVAPRSEVTTPMRAQMAGRVDSEAPGRVPGNKMLIQMDTRGVQGYDRKISRVSKNEIQPPAPWDSASLQPRPQGPIPGRLEGDRSYFLLRVGELRCSLGRRG